MLGCGTLVVETAGNDSDVELFDVAHIERRILQIQEIILDEEIPAEGAHATRRGADSMRGAADSTREGSDSTREGQDDADQDAIAGR